MKRPFTILALLAVVIAPPATGFSAFQAIQGGRRHIVRKGPRAIPNRYIVVLRDDAAMTSGDYASVLGRAQAVASRGAAVPDHVYAFALRGFAAFMSEADALAVSGDPLVDYVEEDALMEATATTQSAPPAWGLDRIGQRRLPLNQSYAYTSTGVGVNAYVIDTGIRRTHVQFGGRARAGFTSITDGRGTSDCNGHGTHVSGTLGAAAYGVAKSVTLYAVRVLDCSGTGFTSTVIAGVDWVTAHHVKPAVANISITGPASSALDTSVRNSIAAGVTYTVSAGNSSTNVGYFSPARVSEAIVVGSTTIADARSSFSNYGSVIDVFAPGSSIKSAWYTSDTATNTISGTSMASPHVAGVAARYLQFHRNASPSAVRSAIVGVSTTGRLTGLPAGTHNRLLYWSMSQ